MQHKQKKGAVKKKPARKTKPENKIKLKIKAYNSINILHFHRRENEK